VALDPTSPGTVWVSGGPNVGLPWIYRSTDGGATFAAVAQGGVVMGPIVVAPSNSRVVDAENQRTTDGGATWATFGLFD
jgi:hypothetical protein